jgi:hypothetical protein
MESTQEFPRCLLDRFHEVEFQKCIHFTGQSGLDQGDLGKTNPLNIRRDLYENHALSWLDLRVAENEFLGLCLWIHWWGGFVFRIERLLPGLCPALQFIDGTWTPSGVIGLFRNNGGAV